MQNELLRIPVGVRVDGVLLLEAPVPIDPLVAAVMLRRVIDSSPVPVSLLSNILPNILRTFFDLFDFKPDILPRDLRVRMDIVERRIEEGLDLIPDGLAELGHFVAHRRIGFEH